MASYQQKQHELFRELEEKFKKGETPATIVEPVQDYVNDNRICLTSAVFIPQPLQKTIIDKVISPLKNSGRRQYYYLPQSLHMTIQNIRTINHPPLFSERDIKKVQNVFRRVIPKHKSFIFELRGLFEVSTSLSVRGYSDETLKYLILNLRKGLERVGVPDNKTYASGEVFFGNVSVVRYTTSPNTAFFKKVKELKDIDIGRFKARTISLITTNSVCHPKKTKIIEDYNLRLK